MRVLFFSTDYWPDSGGIANHVYYMSRALAEAGTDVLVVGGHRTMVKKLSDKPAKDTQFREITIQRRGPGGIRGTLFLARAANALLKLASEKWDVIHFHNFIPDGLLLGVFNWPEAQIRVMTNHSDILLRSLDQQKNTALFRLVTRSLNGIIGPSPELRDKSAVIQHGGQVLEYIPNGVDIDKFAPGNSSEIGRNLLEIEAHQKAVVAVRRHDPKCGLPYLIQAIPRVLESHPNAVFCLVGDGEQTPLLKQMASDLNLESNIRFLGRMSHDQLPIVFNASYVSVLPSLYEAVSLSGLESMACGIPVVGTNVGGIPEFVIPGETGLLVEPRSPDSLAFALIRLLDAPNIQEKMSHQARNFVSENFSWKAVAQKTINFYRRLGAS